MRRLLFVCLLSLTTWVFILSTVAAEQVPTTPETPRLAETASLLPDASQHVSPEALPIPRGFGTPAPARDRSDGPETPDTLYRVLLEVRSGRELQIARELGLGILSPGRHEAEWTRSDLVEVQRRGLRFRVIGGTTRFTLSPEFATGDVSVPLVNADPPPSTDQTGAISLTSGTVDLPIEDNTGTAQGYSLQSISAPNGAQVTQLFYRTRISDEGDGSFWCGDYEIWLFSGSAAFELLVYDNLGGATDGGYDDDSADDADIYLNWRSTSFFDGEDPNQRWGILVYDNWSGDDGKMDYIQFEVHWEVPSSGDDYEPDDSWDQAWPHPHNYTSAFRSIDPAGDEDWITFTLAATSNVVIETDGPAGDTEIWLYDGSLGQVAYDDDSGNDRFSRISRSSLGAGTYYLKVEEYGNSQVIADYVISLSVTTASLPDLEVPSFTKADAVVREGGAFWVEATVENSGGSSAPPSHIRFFLSIDGDFDTSDDFEILPEKSVIALSAGGTTRIRWDFDFPDVLDATNYLVWPVFVADSRNEVTESNETNTYKAVDTGYISVWQPVDLTATAVYLRSQPGGGTVVASPLPGQQVYPHVDFSISAESAVAGPAWRIDLDASTLCQGSGSMTSGSYTAWCTSPWTALSGLHSLHGSTDPNDLTWETNESNNDTYRNYTIDGTPDIRVEPLDLYFSAGPLSASRNTDEEAGRAASRLADDTVPTLRLRQGDVDLGRRTNATGDLAALLSPATVGERQHLLLQFRRLLHPAERASLEAQGIRILRYIPDNGYWASVSETVDPAPLAQGGGLYRAWRPPAEFKTSRGALSGQFPPNTHFADGTVLVHVTAFEDVTPGEATAAIEAVPGARVVEEVFGHTYAVRLPPGGVQQVARLDGVEWVEAAPPPRETHNEVAAQRIAVDRIRLTPWSLDGTGTAVGIWDGGRVDDHPDFGNRLTLQDPNATVSSHSTHVAGTVGGSGGGDAGARGMAPVALLHSWDWNQDVTEMRNEGPTAGIRLSNHSYGFISGWYWSGSAWVDYGDSGFGLYDSGAAEWDDIVQDTGLLIFKSAGNDRNDGPDWPSGPRMDGPFHTIGYTGNAKNILTICATEDDDSMSTFSSWGPTDDGRLKPDLCANGTTLWSTVPNGGYDSNSGTSMASPSAAGAGALLFELFRNRNGGDPQPHLLKALLINGAQDQGRIGPDYEFGWGLIDAEASARIIDDASWFVGTITATGDQAEWTVTVPSGTPVIKITAAWTDRAGAPSANPALVNDLDLELIEPGGTIQRAWVLDSTNPGASATRGSNRVDNVEQVLVNNPPAGTWTVRVRGAAVALGPQEVAVAASGIGTSSPPPGDRSFTIHNDGTGTLQVTQISLDQPADWISWSPSPPFTLTPGQQQQVQVAVDFSSAPSGTTIRRLLIASDDPDESPYPGGVDVHVESETCESLTLSNQTVGSATAFVACGEISAGNSFHVVSPGDVTFRSGRRIVLRDGFSVGSGASFQAVIDSSLVGSAEASTAPRD